jgi:NitT/TauT family transport system permease protein
MSLDTSPSSTSSTSSTPTGSSLAVSEPVAAPSGGRSDPPPSTSRPPQSRGAKIWSATWPKLMAVALAIGLWQLVVLSGWKSENLLPGPGTVFGSLAESARTSAFYETIQTTMQRGVLGFLAALVVGSILGIAVSQWRVLRLAVGSLITGLQTMPSIAWFPLAILLFQLSETAIFFVIILGAAPSIANGIISGIDDTSPQLLRAGRMLGARGWKRYRYVILPAALPSYLGGLKQGWAFAWRSLMAGELLVPISNKPSLGRELENARQFLLADQLLATMIVILVLGMVIDTIFSALANSVRRRRGLTGLHSVPN